MLVFHHFFYKTASGKTMKLKKLYIALSLSTLSFSSIAAGLDRSGQSISAFLQPGNYAEAGFHLLDPSVKGTDNNGKTVADMGESYYFPTAAIKVQATDQISLGLLYDQPYGGDATYQVDGSDFSETALNEGTKVKVRTNNAFAEEFHNQLNKMMVLQEGSPITNIVLADENGKMQSLESLRGKIVLIDFWASWCRPCRLEIPNFKKMYEAYHQYGFDIYSVSVDNDASAWKKALTQEQMPWTNVRDDQKVYSNMFNVSSIPFTILIDKEGKVVAKGLRGQDLSNKILEEIKK